jgi:transposase
MKEPITHYVGLDIHKDSVAIAIAHAGRDAPQFVGTTAANLARVCAAVTVIAELGDLTRFAHPRALMSYLGLVPSEHSSGNTRRQGAITRMGNKHARRILVESAWTYRFPAHVGREQQIRQQDQPKPMRDIAFSEAILGS